MSSRATGWVVLLLTAVCATGVFLSAGHAEQTVLIRRSDQYGGVRLDFLVEGRAAFLIQPPREPLDNSKPWVWYSPTVEGHQPSERQEWLFTQLVAAGFNIAGVDVGGPAAAVRNLGTLNGLYAVLTQRYRLAKQPCVLAVSWGALSLYRWASQSPDRVRCIVGIRPLVNLASDPGVAAEIARGGASGSAESPAALATYNPVDQLGGLADRGVPILHLHGPNDSVVPAESNTGLLSSRYQALGGRITVLPLTGEGDDVWQCDQIVSFLVAHAMERAD